MEKYSFTYYKFSLDEVIGQKVYLKSNKVLLTAEKALMTVSIS
tara:strand:+ start:1089 stop:1217 length:129 start_codon:yes stop_codon:yes gene_type:complete